MGGQIFHVVFSLLQNRFQKRARVVQIASKAFDAVLPVLVPRACVRPRHHIPDIDNRTRTHIHGVRQRNCCFEMTPISRQTERV